MASQRLPWLLQETCLRAPLYRWQPQWQCELKMKVADYKVSSLLETQYSNFASEWPHTQVNLMHHPRHWAPLIQFS
ncbi:unnamed protein product, partial [Iphiclides podalirius]